MRAEGFKMSMDTLSVSPDAFQKHTAAEGVEVGGVPLGTSLELLSETVGNLAASGAFGEEKALMSEISAEAVTDNCGTTQGMECTNGCGTSRCV
jgi:hypothetical protein